MKKSFMLLFCIAAMLAMTACGKNASAASTEFEESVVDSIVDATVESTEEFDTNNSEEAVETAELPTESEPELETEAKAETEAEAEQQAAASDPATVDWHNYANNNVFDLTAYAEALGYTWIPDPEWEGLIMYAIDRDGTRYFYCYHSESISIYWGDKNGSCWALGAVTKAGKQTYTVTSRGQEDTIVSEEMVSLLATSMLNLKNNEPLDIVRIFPPDTTDFGLSRHAGIASYYPNGMIKQREYGESQETYSVRPWEDYNLVKTQ